MADSTTPLKGTLFVISGASGTGKTTLIHKLLKELGFFFSISATTRMPRQGEVDGKDYHFMSSADFESLQKQDELLEWARVHDYFYGTPKKPIFHKLDQGESVVLDLDSQGGKQIKSKFPEAVLIFIMPPALEDLRHRLESRGTDSPQEIAKRLEKAQHEIAQNRHYDYIVINEELNEAYRQLKKIILEHLPKK